MNDLPTGRDTRLDFFRGVALLVIFTDHIRGNPLTHFTPHAFGFSDAAAWFVFISGVVSGLVYGRTLRHDGFAAVWIKALKRAGQIYAAYAVTTFACFAVVAAAPPWARSMGVGGSFGRYFHDPTAFRDTLLLKFLPTVTDVLVIYILFLLALPAALWLRGRSPAAMLVASGAIYAGAQLGVLRMPAWWQCNFNPLGWQFLFFIGVSLGDRGGAAGGPLRVPGGRRVVAALAVTLVAMFVLKAVDVVGHEPGARWTNPGTILNTDRVFPLADKGSLGVMTLAHFLLGAWFCAALVPRDTRLFRTRVGRAVVVTGRHSLPVYCLAAILSQTAELFLLGVNQRYHGYTRPAVILANLIGWALLVAAAHWLERFARASAANRPDAPTAQPVTARLDDGGSVRR